MTGLLIKANICLILSLSAAAAAQARECRVKDLTRNCEVFLREERERIPLGDGTFVLNPRLTRRMPAPTETLTPAQLRAREARMGELFRYAQDKMIASVTRGRSESSLSAAERNIVERIRRTRLGEIDTSSGSIGGANGGLEVSLSGGMLTAPEGLAVSILAHEIGHSVDTCALRSPVLERTRRHSREELLGDLVDEVTSSRGGTYLQSRYPGDGEAGVKVFHNLTREEERPLLLSRTYVTHRAAREAVDAVVARGGLRESLSAVDRRHNPALAVLQCHASGDGPLGQATRPLANLRPQEADIPRQDPALAADCLSQAGEVSADIWGARVMAEWVRENPPRHDWDKLGLLTPALVEACGPPRGSHAEDDGHDHGGKAAAAEARPRRERPPASARSERVRSEERPRDNRSEHASFVDRFEQIYMDQTAVQQVLGCRNPEGVRCADRFGGGDGGGGTSAGAATTGATPSGTATTGRD